MTESELRDAAWAELVQTTVGWDKAKNYSPSVLPTTHWGKAKAYLDLIGAASPTASGRTYGGAYSYGSGVMK